MPKYDLAVAGAGLGGLAAAALVSSSGKKVIVLESGATLDAALGVRDFDGFRFFQGPSLSYGFEEGGGFREIFAKLSPIPGEQKPARHFQIALPDRRITVSADQEETHDELRREFPLEIETIDKFYRDLKKESVRIMKSRIASYFSKHRSAAGFIGKYHFSREFTVFLDIQSRFFFRKPLSQLSLSKLITIFETMPIQFHGGTRALADRLLAALRKNGGDATFGDGLAELVYKNGRPAGVKSGQHLIEANIILLNTPRQPPPTFYLGILDDVVPVGMAPDVLYLPDYAKPAEFLNISMSAENDISSAPLSARALTVSLGSSGSSAQHDQDALIGPLAEIVPYLNDNVFFIEPSPVVSPSLILPGDVTRRPILSSHKQPILFKTSKRNLFVLDDAQYTPLELMTAVHKFVATVS